MVPLQDALAHELRNWKPPDSKPSDRVLEVPRNLVRMLKKDLEAAGIQYKDDAGRVVDVHALRHTFGTHLSKNGVAPRTAQSLMRHSNIDMTMRYAHLTPDHKAAAVKHLDTAIGHQLKSLISDTGGTN